MSSQQSAPDLGSVGVFCASSNGVDPAYAEAARQFGAILAREGVRMVYGGGGVGLMGACAGAAHAGGGEVFGVMPAFLQSREGELPEVKTVIVQSMHERKALMYEQSDAFAILPGGIGTLEEVIELLSWGRLGLHAKPVVFLDVGGFWQPLFALFRQSAEQGMTPAWFLDSWRAVRTPEELLPAMRAMAKDGAQGVPGAASLT